MNFRFSKKTRYFKIKIKIFKKIEKLNFLQFVV